jgi:hypothetical protein
MIMQWAIGKKYVTMFALNPFWEVIESKSVVSAHMELQLVFGINNDHCYPIIQKELKNRV